MILSASQPSPLHADYYADQADGGDGIAAQLVRQLAEPRPADRSATTQLSSYRRLRQEWKDWEAVQAVLAEVAERMVAQ